MASTNTHSCNLWNHEYTGSIEAIFKLVELVFGGGAWGIIAVSTSSFSGLTGPFAFYMWVVVGSWSVTLATYLLNLTSPKSWNQPSFNDLVAAMCFGLTHIIAAIVFCVYAFEYLQWPDRSQAITIAVLVWITTVVYLLHGCSIVTYFMSSGPRDGENGKVNWLWESIKIPSTPAANKPNRKRAQDKPLSDVISNPVAIATYGQSDDGRMQVDHGQAAGHEIVDNGGRSHDHEGVIYEDVPMEPSAPKIDYRTQQTDNENLHEKMQQQNNVKVVEENEYLNPV